ncbi:hypothetical protein FRC00_001496 [Tulasnella sp. 408]|nr:hypothetical protein FRC00_001496 [Tulasnella sp. 408]
MTEGSNASTISCLKGDTSQMRALLMEKYKTTPLDLETSSINSTGAVFCKKTRSPAPNANVYPEASLPNIIEALIQ